MTTCGIQFFPIMWFLGIKLSLSDLAASTPLSQLASSPPYFLRGGLFLSLELVVLAGLAGR